MSHWYFQKDGNEVGPISANQLVELAGSGEMNMATQVRREDMLQCISAEKVKELSGTSGELKIEFIPYESFTGKKYEDVMRRVPDTSLCKQLLGVEALVTLDEGLKKTIEWQRKVTFDDAETG